MKRTQIEAEKISLEAELAAKEEEEREGREQFERIRYQKTLDAQGSLVNAICGLQMTSDFDATLTLDSLQHISDFTTSKALN